MGNGFRRKIGRNRMKEAITQSLHSAFQQEFKGRDFELVGLAPIEGKEPAREGSTLEYLIQIKQKIPKRKKNEPTSDENQLNRLGESIYLPNGKLNTSSLQRYAELLYSANEFQLARNIYSAILKSGEQVSPSFFRLAECFEAEGKLDDAIAHYEESIAHDPSLDSYQRLAALYLRLNKEIQAAETLERAQNLKTLKSETRFELAKAIGNSWSRAKRHDLAEKYYLSALQAQPSADDVRSNLGVLYLQQGKITESTRNFQDALASNPNNPQALAGLASCYLASGNKKEAHDKFAKSLELDINNPTALYYLVKCAYDLKIYSIAAKYLDQYIKVSPENPNLLYSLAGLQYHLGRIEAAKLAAERVLSIQEEHSGAKELLKMIQRYSMDSEFI